MRSLPRHMQRPTLHLLLLLLIVTTMSLALSGCGNGGTTTYETTDVVGTTETTGLATTSSSVESTITSTTAPSSSGPGVASTSSEEVLPNGHIKACGIIKEVWSDGGAHKIKIDYVDFLTGDEADAAAVAAGEISPGEHVENDYYVRNNNTKLRTFTVSGNAVITTDERSYPSMQLVTHTWTEFAGFWTLSGEEAYLSHALWWIERDGETVVRIDQQFVP